MTRTAVVAAVVIAAATYVAGWLRLANRAARPPRPWRLGAAMGALAAISVALASPLDALAHQRFTAHMVQHLLLLTVVAPLALLADPFPVVLWALPAAARSALRRLFARGGALRRLLVTLTAPPIAWLTFLGTVWLWHLPALYERALADDLVHGLEHVTLVAAALVFWWPLLDAAPRVRRPPRPAAAIVYVVLAAFQTSALGLALALAPSVLYPSYAVQGVDALEDQAWGGIIMWSVSGLVDMAVVLALVWRFLTNMGGLATGPPSPPALGAPRQSRGAPRNTPTRS